MPFDPYRILGLAPSATPEEIRQAYLRLARRFHPDVNSDKLAEERFKELAQAHSILTNPRRKALFDEFGEESLRLQFDPARARARRAAGDPPGKGPGQGMRREPAAAGSSEQGSSDVLVPVEIDLGLAIRGGELLITSPVGQAPIRVALSPGVKNGERILVAGRGRPGRRGRPPGDLVLQVTVRPHAHYHRDGEDLHLELPVTILEILRGASVEIPAPRGRLRIQIPANSRGGERLRLRGQGMPLASGGHGDLLVQLSVRLPEPDRTAERFLEQLSAYYRGNPREDLDL